MGVPSFSRMNPENYWSKIKQNNSTELLGSSFHNIYSNHGSRYPLDPEFGFFPEFPGFSIGNRSFLKDRDRKSLVEQAETAKICPWIPWRTGDSMHSSEIADVESRRDRRRITRKITRNSQENDVCFLCICR